jgi:hypothetical protein
MKTLFCDVVDVITAFFLFLIAVVLVPPLVNCAPIGKRSELEIPFVCGRCQFGVISQRNDRIVIVGDSWHGNGIAAPSKVTGVEEFRFVIEWLDKDDEDREAIGHYWFRDGNLVGFYWYPDETTYTVDGDDERWEGGEIYSETLVIRPKD